MKLDPKADLVQALNRMRQHPDVLCEPNYRVHITESQPQPVSPNDFDFAQLWGFHNVGQADGTAGADIGMPAAWQFGTGDRRIVAAVIDNPGLITIIPTWRRTSGQIPRRFRGMGLTTTATATSTTSTVTIS